MLPEGAPLQDADGREAIFFFRCGGQRAGDGSRGRRFPLSGPRPETSCAGGGAAYWVPFVVVLLFTVYDDSREAISMSHVPVEKKIY